jgi:hypothetical protein
MNKGIYARVIFMLVLWSSFSLLQAQDIGSETTSQVITISGANTRTAMRCLDLARTYLLDKRWQKAWNQAELGLNYDDSIADLWYVQANSLKQQGSTISQIMEPLKQAINRPTWVYWNSDAARLMLAEMYLKTGLSHDCLALLDKTPKLASSDAQYIRAQALYNINDTLTARSIILGSANAYPNDSNFPLLFFKRELMRDDFSLAQKDLVTIANLFLKRTDLLSNGDENLLLYASQFTQCEFPHDENAASDLTIRLLKAWKATNAKNLWYSVFALQVGLVSQQQALDYITPWINDNTEGTTIQFDFLEKFSKLLTDKTVCDNFAQLLDIFSGNISFDINKDSISDLTVWYYEGRPKTIYYDENQDGIFTWQADCDFGVPYKISFPENDMIIVYGNWPYINRVTDSDGQYDLVPNALPWSVVQIVSALQTSIAINKPFYIPVISSTQSQIFKNQIYNTANTITVLTDEQPKGTIRFSLKGGQIQNATWIKDGQPYAYGMFENGILKFRNVDFNLDGFYELCEVYGFDINNADKYNALQTNLFGQMPNDGRKQLDGLYLSQLIVDNDNNSIPEYIEEFLPNGGRLCSWYSDDSENWDYQYVQYQDGSTILSRFRKPFSKAIVEIQYKDNIPVQVVDDGVVKKVVKDPDVDFYWIGSNPIKGYAIKLIEKLNQSNSLGVYRVTTTEQESEVESSPPFRIFAVCYGNLYFGEKIER